MTSPKMSRSSSRSSLSSDAEIGQFLCCTLYVIVFLVRKLEAQRRRRVDTRYPRIKPSFENLTDAYSEADFHGAFRMSRESFNKLCHGLTKSSFISERSPLDQRSIPAKVRIAIGVRVMAGASVHDLMLAYQVSKSSVHKCFKAFISAVIETMDLPGIPEHEDGLKKLSMGFKTSRKFPNPLSGCIGALDGILLRIKKPRSYENPSSFFCRKGYFSIPVQAVVDSSYRFLDFSALAVGSTNDALAFVLSPLFRFLEAGKLILGYYIVGDNAYTLSNSLICPYPGKDLECFKDSANFFLSSMRIHVEQAFGILKRRWRVFYNGELNYSVDDCVPIIGAGMLLHNFCIDNAEVRGYVYSEAELEELRTESDEWHQLVRNKTGSYGEDRSAISREITRDLLREVVKEKGLLRPTRGL